MTKFELPEKPKKTNTSEDFNNLRKAVDELDKFDYAWKTYANKADRRINTANKHIEELERENQRLVAENLAIKTLVDNVKPQQALPVVPECVDMAIKQFKNDQLSLYGSLNVILSDRTTEIYVWISEGNQNTFALAFITGKYQVEKPQLFYLKNKMTDDFLYTNSGKFSECEKNSMSWRLFKKSFTKAEIDSMKTGSYEQIEVAE